MGKIIPTKGQLLGINQIEKWFHSGISQLFVLVGPAGTGKTTVAQAVLDRLGLRADEVLFVTFTGKASAVLATKGLNSSTIHSALMEVCRVPLLYNGAHVIKNDRVVTKLDFRERDHLGHQYKLIWVDEGGTVGPEYLRPIMKHGIPVVVSGDIHQLPPIFGESPFFKHIDCELWEITRQAEGSGIIQLATMFREGKEVNWFMNFKNQARIMPKSFLQDKHMLEASMVIAPKNKNRDYFNNRIRELHGSTGKLPNVGDKLICRKNNWNMALGGVPLINGTVGTLVNPIRRSECDLGKGIYRIDFKPDYLDEDDYDYYESLACDYDFLQQPCGKKEVNAYNHANKLEFGEAITVYQSQGSQFPNVMYWDDWMFDREYMRKTRYTAATRAELGLTMFM
jgi:exodeoxyribonuclease-5